MDQRHFMHRWFLIAITDWKEMKSLDYYLKNKRKTAFPWCLQNRNLSRLSRMTVSLMKDVCSLSLVFTERCNWEITVGFVHVNSLFMFVIIYLRLSAWSETKHIWWNLIWRIKHKICISMYKRANTVNSHFESDLISNQTCILYGLFILAVEE